MLRDLSYAAIAALLAGSVHSAPVEPEVKVTSMSHPIGHDSDYVHIASLNEVVPQHISHTLDHMNLTDVHAWNPTGSIEKRLNGEDNRFQYTDTTNYPFRATGRIIWSNGVFCSGALVGPRHVLTAKHCALTDGSTGIFYPGYDNGASSYGQGNIVLFYTVDQTGGQCDTKYDHAVMVLDNRLGDALGYFGAVTPDSSRFNQAIFTTQGYPGDRDGGNRPYRQDSNTLQDPNNGNLPQLGCDATGPIYSDSDVAGGQSGSPIWTDNSNIWGALSISIGYSDGTGGAGWASGDAMISTINQARSEQA